MLILNNQPKTFTKPAVTPVPYVLHLVYIRCFDNTWIKEVMQNHMGFMGFAAS